MTETVDTIDTLEQLGMIKHGMQVLDLGCGGGNWAIDFIKRGYDITYLGLDIQRACESIFHAKVNSPKFKFSLLNIHNIYYNPMGRKRILDAKLPLEDSWADLVICHSLFTHLGKLANAEHYMQEICRVLKPNGFLWITFFVSPPNKPDYRTHRTVYLQTEVDKLLAPFTKLYWNGGNTEDYNDQLMIGARYEHSSQNIQ